MITPPFVGGLAVYKTYRKWGTRDPQETVSVTIGLGALLSNLVDRLFYPTSRISLQLIRTMLLL